MEKLTRLREAMGKVNVDGLLITSTYNRRYMTNFTGTAGVVLISLKEAKFITDFRYVEQASKQAEGYEIVQHKGTIIEEVGKQVKDMKIEKLGFEQEYLTFALYKQYESAVNAQLSPYIGYNREFTLDKDFIRD